jgi:ribonuclease Z
MGIITMLRHVLRPPWFDHSRDGVAVRISYTLINHFDTNLYPQQPPTEPTIELFGPAGLRNFVRACLFATATRTADKYVVHELLGTDDLLTSCTPEHMHGSEAPGRDIRPDDDGFWQGVLNVKGYGTDLVVDAGPIVHRGLFSHKFMSRPQAHLELLRPLHWLRIPRNDCS